MKKMNDIESSKKKLLFNLHILKKGREKLLQDFIHQNPEVFLPIFKYENNLVLMKLAKEKFFCSWLNYHWTLIENYIKINRIDKSCQLSIKENFAIIFHQLLENIEIDSDNYRYSSLFVTLLKEKVISIEKIIKISDSTDEKFNRLLYEYERDKVLFEREITKMKNDDWRKDELP